MALVDNRKRTTGAKRNDLIDLAKGEYVTFIDDDDWAGANYVQSILGAIDQYPGTDCIVFDVAFYLHGDFVKLFKYGQEYGWQETDNCI